MTQELLVFETAMNNAIEEQLNILSPNTFKVAQKSLEDANSGIQKNKDKKFILHQIAIGRAYLKRASQIATLSHSFIEDVVFARRQAVSAGGPALFPNKFQKQDKILQNITLGFEYDTSPRAPENRSALRDAYLELELDAVKDAYLGRSRKTIVEAINGGAKTYASESLATAIKNYKDAYEYITNHRHDINQISRLSEALGQSADQVMQLTQLALENAKKKQTDERFSSVDQINIKQSAVDRKVSDKFEKARLEFTKNEAEVYKQGNTLTIRLRGLEFPSSKAVLKGEDFSLLGKVQRVIRDFGNSSVVVEGHTDSIGDSSINEKISFERAKTVRDYLLSIDILPAERIKAMGLGYKKPLATNKTISGRAQNRRVDVIITVDEKQIQ
jgi:outer membrane protein OmpA-like peptidoglycan-associated protein